MESSAELSILKSNEVYPSIALMVSPHSADSIPTELNNLHNTEWYPSTELRILYSKEVYSSIVLNGILLQY